MDAQTHIAPPPPSDGPALLVVGGGKGGVGKTCVAVNLSIEIARRGWRVVLFDADLSCSNIETVLGFHPAAKLDDFFRQKGAKDLPGIMVETPYPNLRLIPGTSGLLDAAHPRYQQKAALMRELTRLDADVVVVDLDAGAHLSTLDFFLLAPERGILVINPERTSIDNAFKFLRAALYRRIVRFYNSDDVMHLLHRAETLTEFMDRVGQADDFDDTLRGQILREITALAQSLRPKIVVNKASNAYEAKIAANILIRQARQLLMVRAEPLGHILFDKQVSDSVNSGVPYIISHPRRKAGACVRDLANRLGYF